MSHPTSHPTGDDVETILRETLSADADAAVPWGVGGADPWPRVERAHRRDRARRLAGVAAAVVAVTAIGALAARPDEPPPAPAGEPRAEQWQYLDDGRTRGEPVDAATRADVARQLATKCCGSSSYVFAGDPASLRFLWNGTLGGHRTALVRATVQSPIDPAAGGGGAQDVRSRISWVGETAPGRWETFGQWDAGPAVTELPYVAGDGERRMIAVVHRDATVEMSQALIRADGTVVRDWTPVTVRDGTVDVPVGDPRRYAPTDLRVTNPSGSVMYGSSGGWNPELVGVPEAEVTEADVTRATAATRGDPAPAGVHEDVRTAVRSLLSRLGSDPENARPAVLWAGADEPGHAVVVATAGHPGQGRLLVVRGLGGDSGIDWEWRRTVPAAPVETPAGPIAWRVAVPYAAPTPTGHVVGWLLPAGAGGVRVTVNGRPVAVGARDGLSLVEVEVGQTVRVRATLAGGESWDRTIAPGDVQGPFDPERTDLFPPGPDPFDPR
jgi:hypothetical protein